MSKWVLHPLGNVVRSRTTSSPPPIVLFAAAAAAAAIIDDAMFQINMRREKAIDTIPGIPGTRESIILMLMFIISPTFCILQVPVYQVLYYPRYIRRVNPSTDDCNIFLAGKDACKQRSNTHVRL